MKAKTKMKKQSHEKILPKGQESIIIVSMGFVAVFFSLFFIFPIIYAFVGSFFNWQPLTNVFDFIGIDNYKNILTDPLFWSSLGRTFYFTIVVVVLRTVLGLIFAAMINSIPRCAGFFRTVYFLPVVTSIVAVSMLWKYFYDPSVGLFNSILMLLNLPTQAWLRSETLVLPSIMLMTLWKELGYAIVLYLAGINGIPSSFYEAAVIDGASKYQTFKHITIPLLRPTTLFIVVTSVIQYLQVFTPIFVMTSIPGGGPAGGPGTSSHTIVYLLYQKAFAQQYQFGLASAIAVVLFVIILIITVLQMKVMKSDWRY